MPRLPIVGQDGDEWGQILAEFLETAHNPDGTFKDEAVQDAVYADILEDDIAFAVVDEQNAVTVLEIGLDGNFTDRAAAKAGIPAVMDTDTTELAFAIVDENDRRTDLEVGPDGHIPDRVIALWAARIAALSVTEPMFVALGDSLTEGTGTTSGNYYYQKLATYIGHTVRANALGGDTSTGIAARQNGSPWLIMPSGGEFPASGSVSVTITTPSGDDFYTTTRPYTGTVAGIAGTLVPSSTPTFTRTAAGDAVTVTQPQPFTTTLGADYRGYIHLIWAGSNNPTEHDRVLGDIAAMLVHMTDPDKRALVLGPLNSSTTPVGSAGGDAVVTLNTSLLNTYGRRYLDIRGYLINYGLADAGITPTATDTANIAAGVVPESLRSDSIHLNATGYDLVAQQVAARLEELEWI